MRTTLRCRVFGHKPDYANQEVEQHTNVRLTVAMTQLLGDPEVTVVSTNRTISCSRHGCQVVMKSNDWPENPLSLKERYFFPA